MIKNDQLVKYYIDTMNQALHPHDLIYRNCFEYKIPQLSYSSQKLMYLVMVVVVINQGLNVGNYHLKLMSK